MRAWQLLDVFSANRVPLLNTAGLVNLNTASRDVLRLSLPASSKIKTPRSSPPLCTTSFYPPTVSKQADLFADAVINSRPLLSTSALSAIRVTSRGRNPNRSLATRTNITIKQPPTEWNDTGREELFAKIFNMATTRKPQLPGFCNRAVVG